MHYLGRRTDLDRVLDPGHFLASPYFTRSHLAEGACTGEEQGPFPPHGSVGMFGQPVLAPLREKIVEMPDWREWIDAAMVSGRTRDFGSICKMDFAVGRAAEYADGGSLPFCIFHKEIVVKRIVVAGEKTELVPSPAAAPLPEAADLHFGDQHEIDFVAHVLCDSRVAVSPHVAHPARKLVVRSPHQVIDDQAVLAGSE